MDRGELSRSNRGARGARGAPRAPSTPGKGRRTSGVQLALSFRAHGGARPGAGRKPKGERAGVSHAKRPSFGRGQPVHVTLRVRGAVPKLRTRKVGRVIFAAFARAREHLGIRLTHFSVQDNHLHLLVEAANRVSLSRAMQGLGIRLARRLNHALARRGSLFSDRYHARALKTPLEVRRAILYVLNNYRKHLAQNGASAPWDWADPYSSVDSFDGFRNLRGGEALAGRRPCAEFALGREPPVAAPRFWLLAVGWRRHGLLSISECPSPGPARRGSGR